MFGIYQPYCGHRRHVLYAFLNSSKSLKIFRNPHLLLHLRHVFVGPNYKIKSNCIWIDSFFRHPFWNLESFQWALSNKNGSSKGMSTDALFLGHSAISVEFYQCTKLLWSPVTRQIKEKAALHLVSKFVSLLWSYHFCSLKLEPQ